MGQDALEVGLGLWTWSSKRPVCGSAGTDPDIKVGRCCQCDDFQNIILVEMDLEVAGHGAGFEVGDDDGAELFGACAEELNVKIQHVGLVPSLQGFICDEMC